MTDKELRKLNRAQLLELLLTQSREMDRLKEELAAAQEELRNRKMTMERCGSIAEASLALTNIFEEAQAAADWYLENVKSAAGQKSDEKPAVPVETVEQAAVSAQDTPEESERILAESEGSEKVIDTSTGSTDAQPLQEDWDTYLEEIKRLCDKPL